MTTEGAAEPWGGGEARAPEAMGTVGTAKGPVTPADSP